MLIIDGIILITTAWYVDEITRIDNGVQRRPYFFILVGFEFIFIGHL